MPNTHNHQDVFDPRALPHSAQRPLRGVRQDNGGFTSDRQPSQQPAAVSHGPRSLEMNTDGFRAQKRDTATYKAVPIQGWVHPLVKAELQRTAKRADVSTSKVVAKALDRILRKEDAKTEDTRRDLSLRDITERVTRKLEEQLNKPVSWVAVMHDDHTDLRHIHAMVIVKAGLLPVQAMRQEATLSCLEQRRERDLAQGVEQGRDGYAEEGPEWERERLG